MKQFYFLALASIAISQFDIQQQPLVEIKDLNGLDSALGVQGLGDLVNNQGKDLQKNADYPARNENPPPVYSPETASINSPNPSLQDDGRLENNASPEYTNNPQKDSTQQSVTPSEETPNFGNTINEPNATNPGGTAIPPQSPETPTNTYDPASGSSGDCKLGPTPSGRGSDTVVNLGQPADMRGQCTEWADGRYYQLTGKHVDFINGIVNALDWANAASKTGWQVSETPTVPSIVVLQPQGYEIGSTGHVAIVESTDGDNICTSNWNMPTLGKLTMKNFDKKTLPNTVRYLTHSSYKP